ncbi:MAG: sulfatase [Chloroflexota bacterium]
MKRALSWYGQLVQPWLCLAVYLWALVFQASYGTGILPLLARLADASVILWTLVFWTGVLCAGIAFLGLIFSTSLLARANKIVCWVCAVWTTAIFLIRWFQRWHRSHGDREIDYWLIVLTLAVLYLMIRWSRTRGSRTDVPLDTVWQDSFSFLVCPILLLSVATIALRVAVQQMTIASGFFPFAALPSKETRDHLPNVILIVADSLRAESMSLYGHPTRTTPLIDRFAASSTAYLNTHSNATSTTPSMLSLFTGKSPLRHGRLTRVLPIRSEPEDVMMILGDSGYVIGAISSNVEATYHSLGLENQLSRPESVEFNFITFSWLRNLGVFPTRFGGRMYAELVSLLPFLGYPNPTSVYGRIDQTLAAARQAVTELRRPFFLSIHIHEPHESYSAGASAIDTLPKGNSSGSGTKVPVAFYAHYDRRLQPLVNAYKRRYEASVRVVDKELGAFFDFLEGQSWFGNSLIIFTGDHGESFERGYLGHGEELYENSTWVPLVIKYPGQTKGERVVGITQSIDITPTILRALALPVPDWMEGHALMPSTAPAKRFAVATNYKSPSATIFYPLPTKLALWWEQYKLIVACGQKHTELYDLRNDPGEQHNIADSESALVSGLEHRLKDQLARQPHHPKLRCPSLA